MVEWLPRGQYNASEVRARMGSIQGMMVHADGRAEIGHHRVEEESTQALALVHAGPSMRCRQFGLNPYSHHPPECHHWNPTPHSLATCIILAGEGQKGGDLKLVMGPAVFEHLCQYAALPIEVRKWGRDRCP